ncbi:hypothetical protein GW17_00046209 [Ensete ventricosum]|nr:hypothetical protein GW17_00046209 [Ensete ventricosum]
MPRVRQWDEPPSARMCTGCSCSDLRTGTGSGGLPLSLPSTCHLSPEEEETRRPECCHQGTAPRSRKRRRNPYPPLLIALVVCLPRAKVRSGEALFFSKLVESSRGRKRVAPHHSLFGGQGHVERLLRTRGYACIPGFGLYVRIFPSSFY